jgi:hypothetical protein
VPLELREIAFRLRSRLEESDSRSAELESCLASSNAVAAPVPIICKACIGCATVELVSELIKQQKKSGCTPGGICIGAETGIWDCQ